MKKTVSIGILFFCTVMIFAASYADNQYQRLAEGYTARAQEAFDSGEYDLAVEYTIKAEENAELSRAYIELMLARADADTQIRVARNRLVWARSIKADVNYPDKYNASSQKIETAQASFAAENYAEASAYAKEAMDLLSGIQENLPLPKYYVVQPWPENGDCFWNIAGEPYVYNDPYLWKNLYQANKDSMEDSSNPDVIHPGMKIEIPSISGEIREGVYDPDAQYGAFGK